MLHLLRFELSLPRCSFLELLLGGERLGFQAPLHGGGPSCRRTFEASDRSRQGWWCVKGASEPPPCAERNIAKALSHPARISPKKLKNP
jgi:hypothetical protein